MSTLETILLLQTVVFTVLALLVGFAVINIILVLHGIQRVLKRLEHAADDISELKQNFAARFWQVLGMMLKRRR